MAMVMVMGVVMAMAIAMIHRCMRIPLLKGNRIMNLDYAISILQGIAEGREIEVCRSSRQEEPMWYSHSAPLDMIVSINILNDPKSIRLKALNVD